MSGRMIDRTPAEKAAAIQTDPEGYLARVRAEPTAEAHLFVAEQMSKAPHRKPGGGSGSSGATGAG